MDPWSVAGRVVDVIRLIAKVFESLKHKEGTSESRTRCVKELGNIDNLLRSLRFRIEEKDVYQPWVSAVHALAVENGPLDKVKQALQTVEENMTNRGLMSTMFWIFEDEEWNAVSASSERLKPLLEIALQKDYV